jgi:hypothetical protein
MYIAFYISAGLVIVGAMMAIVGGTFYRRPGESLLTRAPAWRSNGHLYPRGVILVGAGLAIATFGSMLLFLFFWLVIANLHPDLN